MDEKSFRNLNDRLNRLERQNVFFRILGLSGWGVLAFLFLIGAVNPTKPEITARKIILVDNNGKECGSLGYDSETNSQQLILKRCEKGLFESVNLGLLKDGSGFLRLSAMGNYPIANLQANFTDKQSSLDLMGEFGSGNSGGNTQIGSGSKNAAPHIYLEGREKGRVDLFGDSVSSFQIQNGNEKKRFSIDKANADSITLHFFAKDGNTETHRFPPLK